ncbi:MAG: hypothetical protein HWE24_01695 [Oceanospirillaceae bacterium]|nr:hypothetical protein [Oceanospirillaceae bacterium]
MANDASIKATSSNKELTMLAEDGRRLLQYVARHGNLTINNDIAKGIISVSAKVDNNSWTISDEIQLIHCYDRLARQVYPVTIESIKAVVPDKISGKLSHPTASKTITWYRYYTVLTLIFLLAIQMFYLFGYTLIQTLADYSPPITNSIPVEIEANYLLLKDWNHIWMLGQELELKRVSVNNTSDSDLGIAFSTNLIAAQSFVQMLQNYLLPLIYGLLGALIFVLRTLLQQVRNLTYTSSREIGYRLRLTLGCLAGMITGWFLKPNMGEMALSPMALAFLAGYSIEVLFTILDKLIDSIRRQSAPSNNTNIKDQSS